MAGAVSITSNNARGASSPRPAWSTQRQKQYPEISFIRENTPHHGKPKRLPVVTTREEVKAVLSQLSGDKWLVASLMYGAGLRLMECLRLRVQDIDFSANTNKAMQTDRAAPSR